MASNCPLGVVSGQLKQVYDVLKERGNGARLVVSSGRSFEVRASHTFWERVLPPSLLCFFSQNYREENRETVKFFKTILGSRRWEVIAQRCGVNLDRLEIKGLPLTRKVVQQIFLQMANLHLEDAEGLFEFIVNEKIQRDGGVLEREAQRVLHDKFKGRAIKDLTMVEWREMHQLLVPFEMETLFFGNIPSFKRQLMPASDLKMRRRICLTEKMWREGESIDPLVWASWIEKGFEDRQKGSTNALLPHPADGVFRLFGQVDTKTSDCTFYQSLTEKLPSMVKFFGAGFGISPSGWLAIKEGTAGTPGEGGFKRVEPYLLYVLGLGAKPEDFDQKFAGVEDEHFVRRNGERFICVGYSMGGGVAQHAVAHHPGVFERLLLVATPGISAQKCIDFAKRDTDGEMEIGYIIEDGDVVTESGMQLGCGCRHETGKKVRVLFIADHEEPFEELERRLVHPTPPPANFLKRVIALVQSFTGPHWKDSTLVNTGKFSTAQWDNDLESGQRVVDQALSRHAWREMRENIGKGVRRLDGSEEPISEVS